jgi:hypothetical protein
MAEPFPRPPPSASIPNATIAAQISLERQRFQHLRKLHSTRGTLFANSVVVDDAFTEAYSSKAPEALTNSFYCLALSVAAARTQAKTSRGLLATLEQALEELAFKDAGAAQKIMKLASATVVSRETDSPGLIKANGSVVYQTLQLPTLPFRLSHARVTVALLGHLDAAYKLFEESVLDASNFEALVRVDHHVKALVIGPVLKLLQEVAIATTRQEMATLRS